MPEEKHQPHQPHQRDEDAPVEHRPEPPEEAEKDSGNPLAPPINIGAGS